MSLSIIYSRTIIGIQAIQVKIEAHISHGLPGFTLVGLAETTVKEAKERVRSAIINSGLTFPAKKITINLAPAEIPKDGSRFDLPIAIAILAASKQIPTNQLDNYEFIGELALSGHLSAICGTIPTLLATHQNKKTLIIPTENEAEAALLPHAACKIASHLKEIYDYLQNSSTLEKPTSLSITNIESTEIATQLDDIIGQDSAKRALEIAASGGHNLLLIGPPGTGKSMLAAQFNSIMPPLTTQEAIECLSINTLTQAFSFLSSLNKRPFRAPHHSISMAALVGGGSLPKPGEITLAHNGTLFLDELPEFDRRVLEALREPLEAGEITISRANAKVCFPARFQLIAAMNPSPQGNYQSNTLTMNRYLSKLSGPLLDRFDLSVDVPPLPKGSLSQNIPFVSNKQNSVKQSVAKARAKQYQRNQKLNAYLTNREVKKYCQLQKEDAEFLEKVLHQFDGSIRSWYRLIKVSRTIADLAEKESIERGHIAEALQYRYIDKLKQLNS